MGRFKKRQLTKRGLIAEVDDLFSDRSDLISGFEVFLPAGVTVDMIREGNSKCSTFSDTYSRYGTVLEDSAVKQTTENSPTRAATAPAAEPQTADWINHPKRANSTQELEHAQPHKKIHFEDSVIENPAKDTLKCPLVENQLFESPLGSFNERTISPVLVDSNPWFGAASVAPLQAVTPINGISAPSPIEALSSQKADTDELMVDFTYKLRFLEEASPEKYQQFLNLITESRVSPSSYPAVSFQK
ncbi:UNVERIFIED_CONTAM: hypothetical protein HDU68_009122 [Siphonaria sp. JEL0065]|nr:hypothetical protein HDU68_009122 [Siphonaria sp. JEL0065]